MASRRTVLRTGLAAASATALAAFAQDAKPITILVGFPPGGSPDFVARTVGEKLSQRLKRPVIIENKTGAGGQLALAALMSANPDGTTYALTPESILTSTTLLYNKLPFDPARIEPVVSACTIEQAVVVAGSTPAKTMPEWLTWMKATPAKAFYGIPAAGTPPHFVGMLLARAAGVDAQAVLYRGGPPMVADLLGGQIPAAVNVLGNFIEHHRAGKLRILATTGSKRSSLLPDIPTITELGFPQAQMEEWYAFVARVGTPRAESAAFAAAVREVVELSDVRAALLASAHNPLALGAEVLGKGLVTARERWADIIKTTGFKLES